MKTILVPTDFSDNARNALNYAVEIAAKTKAKLILFNFFRVPIVADDIPLDPEILEKMEQESYDSLNHLKVEILEKMKGLEIECICTSSLNFAVEEICEMANDNQVNLIVMGTKGASGVAKAVMGSNTAHVIDDARCPVLAVPEQAKYKDFKKFVFATDYSDEDFASIHFIKDMADYFDAEIIVTHIADGHESIHHETSRIDAFKKQLAKQTPIDKISFELIAGENVSERLNQFLTENNADIISMATKKRRIYQRLFDPSLTKKMAYHTNVPLLVFHLQ
jgi:nucleotide-binding universal stress UspA family protein